MTAELSENWLNDGQPELKYRSPSEENDPIKVNHLPVARVKKIMKEGEHQGMISSDAPVILAKACEMLIRDLTLQSWNCTQMTKRCTLQRQDITNAIFKSSVYNFLYDLLTPEDLKPVMENHQMGIPRTVGLSENPLPTPPLNVGPPMSQPVYPKPAAYSYPSQPKPYPYEFRPAFNCSQNFMAADVGPGAPVFLNGPLEPPIPVGQEIVLAIPHYPPSPNQVYVDHIYPPGYGPMAAGPEDACEPLQNYGHN